MTRLILKSEIKKYRRTLSKGQRRASYRRKFRLRYPLRSERDIQKKIEGVFGKITNKIYAFVEGHYPKPILRSDSFETEFFLFMRQLEQELEFEFSGGIDMGPLLTRVLEFMLRYKEEEIAEYMKTLTGKPFYATTEWWEGTKRGWIDVLNRSMSKNINDYVSGLREAVFEAVRANKSFEDVLAIVRKMGTSLSARRAVFLARDMTGKLNGEIEKQLQQSIGIDGYFWQTRQDERVRGRPGGVYASAVPSHWAMESKVCKWTDVSIVSYDLGKTWVPRSSVMPYKHPGEDWLCRCSGAPFSLSLLREIDEELQGERS